MRPGYEIKSIYYYPDLNIFTDEDGNVIFNMFTIATPSQIFLMKLKRGYFYIDHPTDKDIKYEIICPMDDEYYEDMEYDGDPWRSYTNA